MHTSTDPMVNTVVVQCVNATMIASTLHRIASHLTFHDMEIPITITLPYLTLPYLTRTLSLSIPGQTDRQTDRQTHGMR